MISPEYCEDRVWNDRKELIRQSYIHAGFPVNAINLEEEAGLPEPHGPLHTPEQWMPEDDDLEGLLNNESNGDESDDSGHDDDDSDGGGVGIVQSQHDADVVDNHLHGKMDDDQCGADSDTTNGKVLRGGHDSAVDRSVNIHRDAGMDPGIGPDQGDNQGCRDLANASSNNSGTLDHGHEAHNGFVGNISNDAIFHRFDFSNVHSGCTTSTAEAPLTVGSYSWTPIEDVNFWGDLTMMFPYTHQELIRRRILADYEASHLPPSEMELPAMSQYTSLNSCYGDTDTSTSRNKGLDPKLYTKVRMSGRDPGILNSVPDFGLSQAQLDASVAECTFRTSQPSAIPSAFDGPINEKMIRQMDDVVPGLVNVDVGAVQQEQVIKKTTLSVAARKQAEGVSKLEEQFSEDRVQELERFVIKWKASIERMQGR